MQNAQVMEEQPNDAITVTTYVYIVYTRLWVCREVQKVVQK